MKLERIGRGYNTESNWKCYCPNIYNLGIVQLNITKGALGFFNQVRIVVASAIKFLVIQRDMARIGLILFGVKYSGFMFVFMKEAV